MVRRKTIITCMLLVAGVVVLCFALIAGLVLYILALPRQRYDDADAAEALETGTQLMQEWLDENLPSVTITSSENVLYEYPSGPSYLTDYVRGTYDNDGDVRGFVINVVNGDVYLEDIDHALEKEVGPYLIEVLGLPEDTEVVSSGATLLVPYVVEGSSLKEVPSDTVEINAMLPADITDVAAYLRDGSSRAMVSVELYAHPDKNFNIGSLNFDHFLQVRQQENLRYRSLYVTSDAESLDVIYDHYYYEHFAWGDVEPFRVWYRDSYLEQSLDRKGEIQEVGSSRIDLSRDIKIIPASNGYVMKTPSEAADFPYWLYVGDGSELVDSKWQWTNTEDGMQELYWVKTQDDMWCLYVEDVDWPHRFYGEGALTPR